MSCISAARTYAKPVRAFHALDAWYQTCIGSAPSVGSSLIVRARKALVTRPANWNDTDCSQEQIGHVPRGISDRQISQLRTERFGTPGPSSAHAPVARRSSSSSSKVAAAARRGANSQHEGFVGGDTDCCICLSEYQKGEALRRLPCMHRFHSACVDRWLKTDRACPVCKTDVC